MAGAQEGRPQQGPGPVKVELLKGNVYWGTGGSVANAGIIVGQNGVIVVDTKANAAVAKDLLAEIAKLTPKPVTTLILTASDPDHVSGVTAFPAGVTIIAQETCKKELAAAASYPKDRLPTKTFTTDETLTIEGVKVRLLHWAPAHTGGDLAVFLPDEKIVFGGDLVSTHMDPGVTIHEEKTGTVDGWFVSMKGLIDLDADTYVSSHGGLMNKDDMKKKLAFIQARWDNVKGLVAQGKSLDEVKIAMGESTAPPMPNAQGVLPFPTLTECMYHESPR